MRRFAVMFCLLVITVPLGLVEGLVTDLSNRKVGIRYSFQGADLILFGTIGETANAADAGELDVIVVVRGPELPTIVRRKERISGIWVNAQSVTFPAAPGYYAVAATKDLNSIAQPLTLAQAGIGFQNLRLAVEGGPSVEIQRPLYMQALERLKAGQGLFRNQLDSVTLLGEGLFRTDIKLPATVPVGNYYIDSFVFQDGELRGRNRLPMAVEKQGFERAAYNLAHQYPFFYGLMAVIIALAAGWIAGVLGKK